MTDSDQVLLRPDLWELLLPGIKAARMAGRRHVDAGGYVSHQSVLRYRENDAGWPQVIGDSLGTRTKNGPLDWTDLFGFKEGLFTHILVSDVPELAEAAREVSRRAIEDDELMRTVSRLAPWMNPEEREEQVEYELVRRFIGTILNRADALSLESDDELQTIYRQIERARLAEELIGDIIIPLVAVSFDFDSPININSNVWIERIPEEEHRVRAMDWIRHDGVSANVAAAATHAVVLRGVHFSNQESNVRVGREFPTEISVGIAQTLAEAVHIATEMVTGFAQVLVRPHDWADSWTQDLPPLWSAWSGRAYPEELNNRAWENAMTPITENATDEIVRITRALAAAPRNIQIAARRCRRATFRDDVEDIILDAAIGIEALVGKESDALTHRMAQRAAIALADSIPPENTHELLKQFYGIRSKLVHGETPKRWTVKFGDGKLDAVATGRYLLRQLLRNHLLANEPWDATSLDEQMLMRFERPEGYSPAESADE